MFYTTIRQSVESEYILKKSRFISLLIPMFQIPDVQKALQDVRFKYPGANHYCYAYILKTEGGTMERCSDDGEPTGTAGWPILNVLKKKELVNILAIVVRFFGGTLLGTGGLIRAYSEAIQISLDEALIIHMEYSQKLIVTFDYSYYGSFQNLFSNLLHRVTDIQYTDLVSLEIWITIDILTDFITQVTKLTGGKVTIEYRRKDFVCR